MAARTGHTIYVTGLASLIRATDAAGKETKKLVRDELRKAAEPVRAEAALRFASTDARSAARFGVSVRRTGVIAVEQRLRKTTGQHPEFGALQVRRALEPALESRFDEVMDNLGHSLDVFLRRWESHP